MVDILLLQDREQTNTEIDRVNSSAIYIFMFIYRGLSTNSAKAEEGASM